MIHRHAILWAFLFTLIPFYAEGDSGKSTHPSVEGRVVQVISGDSIAMKVGGKIEEVHYIGIQTPQVRKTAAGKADYSYKAFILNTELVGGKIIHLEFDILPRDPAGRLLAYVFLLNGTFVNAELLLHGYGAAVYTPPNGMYRMLFERLEHLARSIGRGMWRLAGSYPPLMNTFRGPFVADRKYKIFHRPGCRWIQGMPISESLHFQSRRKALSQGYLPCQDCKP